MSPRVHIPGKEIEDIEDDKEEDVEEKALEHELQQYCARRKRSSTTAITKPTSSSVFDGFDYHTGFTLEDEEDEEDTSKEEEDEMQEQSSNKNFDNSGNHNLFHRDMDKVNKSEEEEEGNVSNHDVATGDKNEPIEEEEKTILLESINPSEQLPSPARKKSCASDQNHNEKSSSIPTLNINQNREDKVPSESSPILNERPMETETEESSEYYAGDTQPFATTMNLLKTDTNVLSIAGDALQDEKLLLQNLQVSSQKRLDSQRSTGSQSTATLSLSVDVTREQNTPLYNLAIARNVSIYLDANTTTQNSNELKNNGATNLREDNETKSSSGNETNYFKRLPEKSHEEDDDPNMTPSQVLLSPVLTAAKEIEHAIEHDDECIASPRNEQVKGLGLRIQTSHTTNQEKQINTNQTKENANNNATTLESRQETNSLSATANSVDNLKSPTVVNKSIVAVKKKQYISPKSPQWLNAVSDKKTSLVTHKSKLSCQLISKDSYELHDTPLTTFDDDGYSEEEKKGQSIPIIRGKRVRWSSDMGDSKKSGSALESLNFDHPSLEKDGSGKNQQKSCNLSTDSIVNDASIQEKLDDENMDVEDIDSVTDHAILSQGMQDLISYREQLTTKAVDVDAVHRAKLTKYLDEVNHVNDLEGKIQRQSEDISRLTIQNETLVAENIRYQEQLHQRDNLIKKLKGRIALEQKKQSVLDEIKELHDERIKALLEDQKKLKKVIEEQRLRAIREHGVQPESKPRGNDECDGSTVGKMASKANELNKDSNSLNEKTTTPTKKSRKAVTQKTVKSSSSKKRSIAKARSTKLKPSSKADFSLSPSTDKKGTQTQESQESEFEYCDEKIEYHEDSGEEDTEILSAGKMLTCRSMNVIAQTLNTAPTPTPASFNREVFNPIWLTLQQQGGSCECQWHYIQTGSFLGPTHAFTSPHCLSVKDGVAGTDYFVSEVDLVLKVIDILNRNRRVVEGAITAAVQRIKEQSSRGRRSRRLNKQSPGPKLEKKHVAENKTVKSTSTPRLSQSKASNNMSNKMNSTISSKSKRRSIETSSSEEDDHEDKGKDEDNNDIKANQDSTLNPGHTLTAASIFKCSQIINQFGGGKSIIKDLFTPIWSILKSQGRNKAHRWKYKNIPQRSQFGLLCNYAWATPHCLSVAKGKLDVDFFITELDLVMYVCRTIKTSHPDHIQRDILKQLESFQRDSVSPAPSNDGNVAKDEGRKLTFGVASKLCSNDLAMSPSNTTRDSISAVMTESTPQKRPLEYSQTSYDAAEVLVGLGLAKGKPKVISQQTKPFSNRAGNAVPKFDLNNVLPSISPGNSGIYEVGTRDLIQELAKERRTNPVFVKIKKLIREEKKLLLSQIEHESPVQGKVSGFHLTQESPIEERLSFQSASKRRKLNSRRDRLLSGFSFLVSGVDEKVRLQINEMGGTIINDLQSLPQPLRNILFISNWGQRRSYKYLFAVSAGMLMLDSSYIKELKLRDDRYKKNSRRSTCIPPDPLDKNLVSQMRLPLGLNRLSQRYKLGANNIMKRDEYIRNAKIFDSMNLAVVLRSEEASANWKMILEQGGANVSINTKDAQSGIGTVDIILIDSVNLPSLEVVQNDLYKTLNVYGKDTPVIDISWAIQCLINGKRLEHGVGSIFPPKIDVFGNDVKGRDITSYRNKNGVRFEVGDIVKINCTAPGKGKSFSKFMYARIWSLNPRKEDCSVTVSVLDRHERTLIDGGNTKGSPSELTIDSLKNIVGHVLLLKGKDFREIEDSYGGDVESVFIQKRCN